MSDNTLETMADEFDKQLLNVLKKGRQIMDKEGNVQQVEPTAADLNVIRQRLKDCGITSMATQGSPIGNIVDNSDLTIMELPEPQRLFQCGFLVHDDEDYIVVAGAIKPALETFDYAIAIPRVAINAIRTLTMENPFSKDDE